MPDHNHTATTPDGTISTTHDHRGGWVHHHSHSPSGHISWYCGCSVEHIQENPETCPKNPDEETT